MYAADIIPIAGWVWLIGICAMYIYKGYRRFEDDDWSWVTKQHSDIEPLWIILWPFILTMNVCIIFPMELLQILGYWIAEAKYHINVMRWIGPITKINNYKKHQKLVLAKCKSKGHLLTHHTDYFARCKRCNKKVWTYGLDGPNPDLFPKKYKDVFKPISAAIFVAICVFFILTLVYS